METRYHKLFRHSVTTGKCEDCGLIDNHSNACHDAAPIRKIEELYDRLDKLTLQNQVLRDAVGSAAKYGHDHGFGGDMITSEDLALVKLLDDALAFCDGKLGKKVEI